jgi:hypothetical protein
MSAHQKILAPDKASFQSWPARLSHSFPGILSPNMVEHARAGDPDAQYAIDCQGILAATWLE